MQGTPAFRLVRASQTVSPTNTARLQVHELHRFAHPPTLAEPEYATLVSVDCFAGRSVEAKRRLYGEIVDRLEPLGIPRDHCLDHPSRKPYRKLGHSGRAGCV